MKFVRGMAWLPLVTAIALLAACGAGREAQSSRDEPTSAAVRDAVDDSPSAMPSPATEADAASEPPGAPGPCMETGVRLFEAMGTAWDVVAQHDPGETITPLLAYEWVSGYQDIRATIDGGVCADLPELQRLDVAVADLTEALEAGDLRIYEAMPAVGRALRSGAAAYGSQAGETNCPTLRDRVRVSYRLMMSKGYDAGLYPRFTVSNSGDEAVAVELEGEGRATSEYGPDLRMSWGGYSDSRVKVGPGVTREKALGRDTGEVLYVGPGQRVRKIVMHADISSVDQAVVDCPVKVSRAG